MASRRCRAVWSPETTAWRHDRDDGIEKAPSLIDNVGEALVVSVGEIALKRRWLDLVDGKNREQGLMSRQAVPCTGPPRSPQPSPQLPRHLRRLLLVVLTGTLPASRPLVPALALRGRRRAGTRFAIYKLYPICGGVRLGGRI